MGLSKTFNPCFGAIQCIFNEILKAEQYINYFKRIIDDSPNFFRIYYMQMEKYNFNIQYKSIQYLILETSNLSRISYRLHSFLHNKRMVICQFGVTHEMMHFLRIYHSLCFFKKRLSHNTYLILRYNAYQLLCPIAYQLLSYLAQYSLYLCIYNFSYC